MPLSNGAYRDPIPLIQFLSVNGDGTGAHDAIGDYSGTPLVLYVQPPDGEIYVLTQFIMHVSDAGKFLQDKYGALVAALPNGIEIQILDDDGVILDITRGEPVKTNDEYMHISDVDLQEWGGIADSLRATLTKESFGTEIRLDGSQNQRLVVTLNDSFIGLIDQHFMIRGYK